MAASSALKTYYYLAKPGIVYGNVMTTVAGFLFAASKTVHINTLIACVFGTGMVIASACVLNNCIDRDIDAKMERTSKRALVSGRVELADALVYAFVLFAFGFTLLIRGTNWLTVAVGLVGYIAYVALYGYAKRTTIYGTLIGSISGSMPLVAGYTAGTGKFDINAWLLFLIMAAWQMPHFYAIGIYRLRDYKAASLPIWPAVKGIASTKRQILLYTILFIIACALLTIWGHASYSFMVIMLITGAYWLYKALPGRQASNDTDWARGLFGFSLIILLVLSASLSLNTWLP